MTLRKEYLNRINLYDKNDLNLSGRIVKNDVGTSFLQFLLYTKDENGRSIPQNLLDATITVSWKISTKTTPITDNCAILDVEKGLVEYEFKGEVLAYEGQIEGQIKVLGLNQKLSFPTFTINITKDLSEGATPIEDEGNYPILVSLIGNLNTTLADNRVLMEEIDAKELAREQVKADLLILKSQVEDKLGDLDNIVVSSEWVDILNKPTTFPPDAHSHSEYQVKGDYASGNHSHTLDDITETASKKVMTNLERDKLINIEENANNYVHPSKHLATEITEDASHEFVSATQKLYWNNKSDFSGNYSDLVGKPLIPSKTSDLVHDSGFLTSMPSHQHVKSEITDFPAIPTNLSELVNDIGVTAHLHPYLSDAVPYIGLVKEDGVNYPWLALINNPCSDNYWIRVGDPSGVGGILPYQSMKGSIGTASWAFKEIHAIEFFESGTKLSDKYQAKGSYASDSHNHDGDYAPTVHTHDYSPTSHTHTDLHSHPNETVIENLTDNAGKLQYKGSDIVGGLIQSTEIVKIEVVTQAEYDALTEQDKTNVLFHITG